jgi:hypothetical protein
MGLARFDDLNWKNMMSRFPFVLWAWIESVCKSSGDAFSDALAAPMSLAAFVIHPYRFKMSTGKPLHRRRKLAPLTMREAGDRFK